MEEERATTPIPAVHEVNETNGTIETNEAVPATHEAISRPSSTSTTASAAIAQLPGITAMADNATDSPQVKTASSQVHANAPTPPTAQALAQELQAQAEESSPSIATVPTPTLSPISTPTPTPQLPTYTQPTTTAIPAAITPTAPAPAPPAPPAPVPVPAAAPMPAPMQMPIAAPVQVPMNNHIASSPAAHAPTPSGNLLPAVKMMASHPTASAAHPANANGNAPPTQPTCQNCSTSTTPLWRRDEMGSVLCNACGLFLKLHGRPRPISLKTDVIKSRNRVKTMRPDMQKKKQSLPAAASSNGNSFQSHDAANAAATAAALAAVRATQQKAVNGHPTDSPVSRTATPNVYDPNLTAFQTMDHFQHDGLHYPLPGASPGRAPSPTNGDQQPLDAPQTHEQLIAANSSLKTRVSELDLINELYRGRLQQLEQDNQTADNYRHSAEMSAKEAATERAHREEIQRQLDDSHRRENSLKRRLDEMEQELQELKNQMKEMEADEPAHKRPKLEEHSHDEAEQLVAALQAES